MKPGIDLCSVRLASGCKPEQPHPEVAAFLGTGTQSLAVGNTAIAFQDGGSPRSFVRLFLELPPELPPELPLELCSDLFGAPPGASSCVPTLRSLKNFEQALINHKLCCNSLLFALDLPTVLRAPAGLLVWTYACPTRMPSIW